MSDLPQVHQCRTRIYLGKLQVSVLEAGKGKGLRKYTNKSGKNEEIGFVDYLFRH